MLTKLNSFFQSLFSGSDPFEKKLKELLGFTPGSLSFYYEAFRHKSCVSEYSDYSSNERLEFLGDAVIELVVREYLFYRFPDKEEGDLTEMRIKIVNREFLNELGEKLGVEQLIQLEDQKRKQLLNQSSSIHGNVVEALTGAVFLDKGYNAARHFFVFKALNRADNIDRIVFETKDFKSIAVQWAQKENALLEFSQLEEKSDGGEFVMGLYVNGTLKAKGKARKKKKAENEAARIAYENDEFPGF